MLSKGSLFVGVVGALLFVGVVRSIPIEEEWARGWGWEVESTTPPSGWGWGSDPNTPEGQTLSFGQTMLVFGLAGQLNTSNPTTVEGTAAQNHTMNIDMYNYQESNLYYEANDGSDTGGGGIETGAANVTVETGNILMDIYPEYSQIIAILNATSGGISSNPQTSAGMSAGLIVNSASGQVTNGTNVNPGAPGSSGWGWGSGWKVDKNATIEHPGWTDETTEHPGWTDETTEHPGWGWGWTVPQEGITASVSSLQQLGDVSMYGSASDDIDAVAYGDNVNVTLDTTAPSDAEIYTYADGLDLATAGGYVWTNPHDSDFWGNTENDQNMTVSGTNATAIHSKPNSTLALSMQGFLFSDWAQATNGTNLVNNGWGNQGSQGWGSQPPQQGWGNQGSQGWGSQPPQQGWGSQPPPQGWRAPDAEKSLNS